MQLMQPYALHGRAVQQSIALANCILADICRPYPLTGSSRHDFLRDMGRVERAKHAAALSTKPV